jgi:hypothetical protein
MLSNGFIVRGRNLVSILGWVTFFLAMIVFAYFEVSAVCDDRCLGVVVGLTERSTVYITRGIALYRI